MRRVKVALPILGLMAGLLLTIPVGAGAEEPSTCEDICYDREEGCYEACAGDADCEENCKEGADACLEGCEGDEE